MSILKESRMLRKNSISPSQHRVHIDQGVLARPQIEKPGLPAWVETAQHVREKVERQGFPRTQRSNSSREPDALAITFRTEQANYKEEESSHLAASIYDHSETAAPTMAYRRARPAPQPVEVEVRENSWHSGF
jgi:hypothetical protein